MFEIILQKQKNKRVEIHSINGTLFFPFLLQYIMDCELFAYRTHQTKREDKQSSSFHPRTPGQSFQEKKVRREKIRPIMCKLCRKG